jgi:NHLM bacteriocin system ABC transporter ATP-binding protein
MSLDFLSSPAAPSSSHDLFHGGSARPLVLDRTDLRLMVCKGTLDLFGVFGDPAASRRHPLGRLEAGALVCGIAPKGDGDEAFRLVGVGSSDAELLPHASNAPVDPAAVRSWCRALAEAADEPMPDDSGDLDAFNALRLARIADKLVREQREAAGHDWRERRRAHGEAVAGDALARLAGGVGRKPVITGGDPLVAAVAAILSALGVDLDQEALARWRPEGEQASERLSHLLRSQALASRTVILRPDWTLRPGPPLMGFFGTERRPVALVFEAGRWVVHDGSRVVPANEASMSGPDGLAADAYQIYPSFPPRAMSFRDLLLFGFVATRAERLRLVLLMLAAALLAMLTPYASRLLIDDAIPNGNVGMIGAIIGGLLTATFARTVFEGAKSLTMLRSELGFEARLQPALVRRLLMLPPSFFRAYNAGDITDRVLGIQQAREIITGNLTGAAAGSVFSLFSLIPIVSIDWRLALVVFGLALVLGAVIALISYQGLRHERRRMAQKGKLDSFVVQILIGLGKLRAAASEKMGFARWAELFSTNMRHTIGAGFWATIQATASSLLPQLATLTLYIVILHLMEADATAAAKGASAASTHVLTLPEFVSVTAAFSQVIGAVSAVSGSLMQLLVAVPLIERARPLIESEPDIGPADARSVRLAGAIDIRNVSFRYFDKAPRALDEVGIRIGKGEFVAIVGASGSGKSTLMRLLLGFDRPEAGEVFFDGHAMHRLDMAELRRQIGVVLQHGRIVNGTILANITGNSGLGMDEALEAARLVGLERDIAQMPMGMHTVLLDGGATLSGGQRQRVLLARALITKPAVLMLDEATSALDNRTQAIVTETLNALPVTRIVIAHRLSTIQSVDRIVMMDRGKVVETGTYAELMDSNGYFAAHARRQMV